MVYKCASFFAGVGGIDLGFEDTGDFKTVYANEFDHSPIATFEKNFDLKVDDKSITDVTADDVPNVDVVMGGFPCQAFSIAGYRKGFEDNKGRGTLFFDMLRIIKAKKPRVVFAENVKNLISHDDGNTYKVIRESLEDAGYTVIERVMNAMEFGDTPQNRERIYIIGFRDKEDLQNFEWPEPVQRNSTIHDVIDFNNRVDEHYYYTPGKYKGDLYEKLDEAMDDSNAIYQWRRKYVRKNKSGVVPTLTANMGEGGHNVPLVRTQFGIRKLTPEETFRVQGFPKSFKLPTELSDAKLYKQAGNSVCVAVIKRIAEKIGEALKTTDNAINKTPTISVNDIQCYADTLESPKEKEVILKMLKKLDFQPIFTETKLKKEK